VSWRIHFRSWKHALYPGLACLVALIVCAVVAKTTGPTWLWYTGVVWIGLGGALLDVARQIRKRERAEAS
jgi:hypothetical protein